MAHWSAASSSSDFKHKWTHDVFLSFRGEDTRYGFTGNLYDALRRKEINTFIDEEKLGRGEEISPALLKAIEESRVSIVVFSENYANSSWCLDELVTIIECKKSKEQWVHPIFYKVDPSDVRHQKNSVGKALAELQNKSNINVERVDKWKSAMEELAALSGLHLKDGYEYEYIQQVIEDVSNKLDRIFLHIADHLVGIKSRISKVNSLLETWYSDDAQMIGIYGFSGIGKTTLARALYNHIAPQFESKCFLANVRESGSTMQGLLNMQKTLLSKMLEDRDMICLGDVNEGISRIKHKSCSKKVLLVLDDVDKRDQLRTFVGRPDWFGSGSKIIITTRDKGLLDSHGVYNTYEMEELDDQDALELFCWNAFKKSEPEAGYEDLSMRATRQGKNLPLVLEIIGSNLYGKGVYEWKCELDKYERVSNKMVQNILRISYDNLDTAEKKIFLDIACFFKGMSVESCKEIFNTCDFYPDSGIRVLLDKSLINIKDNMLWMHDLLQDMGRRIIQQDPSLEPGERSRLWFHEDVLQVLMENTGSNKIEGIMLKFPKEDNVQWSGEAFKKMTNLRILIVENAHFSQGPKYLPNKLRVLDWKNYPSSSLPRDFHPTKLVILNLPDGTDFKLKKSLNSKYECLTYMNLSYCRSLEEVPDISGIPNLAELYLDHCSNLVKIHDSVGHLNKLVKLSAKYCNNLDSFPPNIKLTALEYLNLRECYNLGVFPNVLKKMEKIRFIDVTDTSIKQFPSSFNNLVGIKELRMGFCPKLRKCFERFRDDNRSSISLPLVSLDVQSCKLSDEDVVVILSCFPKLKKLILDGNEFETLPACIKELNYLEYLVFNDCDNLREIIAIPPHLQYTSAVGCPSLTTESSNLILNQGLNEIHNLKILVDGGNIPEWFDHRSKGGSLSFLVRGKFPVIALGSVLGAISSFFQLRFSLSINGTGVYVFEASFWTGGEDIVLLHDLRTHMSTQQYEKLNTYLQNDWNCVEVSFIMSSGIIKWCGVHAYKKETNMENVLFTSPDDLDQHLSLASANVNETKRLMKNGQTFMQQADKVIVTQTGWGMRVDKKMKTQLLKGDKFAKMWTRGASSNKLNLFQVDGKTTSTGDTNKGQKKKLSKKDVGFTYRIRENVRSLLDPSAVGMKVGVWGAGKLRGRETFQARFGMQEGEKLLKITDCNLHTIAGPLRGILYISTEKVIFYGTEEIEDTTQVLVFIPIEAIREINKIKNPFAPTPTGFKYMEIITQDYSKFQFTRFFRFDKSYNYLQKVISLKKKKNHELKNSISM